MPCFTRVYCLNLTLGLNRGARALGHKSESFLLNFGKSYDLLYCLRLVGGMWSLDWCTITYFPAITWATIRENAAQKTYVCVCVCVCVCLCVCVCVCVCVSESGRTGCTNTDLPFPLAFSCLIFALPLRWSLFFYPLR